MNKKEWRQSRWIHPYELSDTNKVLIVDESEVMDIVDDMEDMGVRRAEAFHQSGGQTEENTGELAP